MATNNDHSLNNDDGKANKYFDKRKKINSQFHRCQFENSIA